MKPKQEASERWGLIMTTIQTLIEAIRADADHIDPFLLQGMVVTAFQNPLLRIVTINGEKCIAHTTAGINGISIRGMDNPLENTSSKDDLRARIYGNLGSLIIERNMGPRYKDDIERAIDKSCHRAGQEMMRTDDFCGPRGQEFSTLLHLTTPSHGSAFRWKEDRIYNLSEFQHLEIIRRREEVCCSMPPYDLVLSS